MIIYKEMKMIMEKWISKKKINRPKPRHNIDVRSRPRP